MSASLRGRVNPWEVWLAKWSHPDRKGYKYRPVLVLEARDDRVVALKLTTSKDPTYPGDLPIEDLAAAGLLAPTIARTSQIQEIAFGDFGRDDPFGRLSELDVIRIKRLIGW